MNESAHIASELNFSEISIGEVFEIERAFTQSDVRQYAELSGDFSPLHIDSEYAANTEFGGCVVHGMLLASMFSQLVGMRIPGKPALYLGQDLAFRRPVLVGEKVRAVAKVTGKNDATGTIVLTTEVLNRENIAVVSGSAKVKVRGSAPNRSASAGTASGVYAKQAEVVLVTGGAGGFGAEIARALANRGIAVAVNYSRAAGEATQVVEAIRHTGGKASSFRCDIRDAGDVDRMVLAIVEQFGGLRYVVNCAIGLLEQTRMVDTEWKHFEHHLDTQVKAVVQISKCAYPHMKGGGAMVNILSQVTGGVPPARMAPYVTAKYALMGLSKALAVEWAEDHIRVNMVSPGMAETNLTQHYSDRLFKMEAARTPLRRIARPSDVAKAVAYLLSEDASFLTGINLFVTGGQVMY